MLPSVYLPVFWAIVPFAEDSAALRDFRVCVTAVIDDGIDATAF